MQIYQYDPQTGIYLGPCLADKSPLEPEVFLIPAHATKIEPPAITDGKIAVFNNDNWTIQNLPTIPPIDKINQIKMQITDLEAQQTPRLCREALIGITDINPATKRTPMQQLMWINDQIVLLRAQIK